MSESAQQPITSVAEFLAHALELEYESRERYRELSDSMKVHNNPEIAKLFKRMARYSDLHADEVQNLAEGLSLPAIAPWAFKWNCLEGPESPCMDDVSYLMNRLQALDLALHNEIRGRDFYAGVVTSSPDPEVRRLAEQMFEEESVHVDLLKEWIALKAQDDEAPLEDLDPPNAPE